MATRLQGDYVRKAAAASAARRNARLRSLDERGDGLQRALGDLRSLGGSMRPLMVQLDGRFVAPRAGDDGVGEFKRAAPLARLLSTRGEAMKLYLTAVYIAQVQRLGADGPVGGALPLWSSTDPSWHSVLGFSHLTRRARDIRFKRALAALASVGMVRLDDPGRHGRYGAFRLLADSGLGVSYRTPPRPTGDRWLSRGMIGVQADLFREGWVPVLTDAEIATYLAILHKGVEVRRKPATQPFFLPRPERLKRYQLSDDSYASHRELAEFGLLRLVDDEPMRRRGRLKPQLAQSGSGPRPFSFTVNRVPKSAVHVVRAKLARGLPAPHLRTLDRTGNAHATPLRSQ